MLLHCCVHLRCCGTNRHKPASAAAAAAASADGGDDGELVTAAVRRAVVAQTSLECTGLLGPGAAGVGPGRSGAASLDYSFEGQDERELPNSWF